MRLLHRDQPDQRRTLLRVREAQLETTVKTQDVRWPSFQSQLALLGDDLHPDFVATLWWMSWMHFWNMLGYAMQLKQLGEEEGWI